VGSAVGTGARLGCAAVPTLLLLHIHQIMGKPRMMPKKAKND
jgi:hypothetical protein